MKFDEVDVGNSYKCSLSETLVICNDKNGDNFNLTLSSTQWQAFKVVNDTFSPGESSFLECSLTFQHFKLPSSYFLFYYYFLSNKIVQTSFQ